VCAGLIDTLYSCIVISRQSAFCLSTAYKSQAGVEHLRQLTGHCVLVLGDAKAGPFCFTKSSKSGDGLQLASRTSFYTAAKRRKRLSHCLPGSTWVV
jgi:hypothetical protein